MSFKVERVRAGMTLNDAAAALYVARNTLYNWERGKYIPSVLDVYLMSKLYGCTMEALCEAQKGMEYAERA